MASTPSVGSAANVKDDLTQPARGYPKIARKMAEFSDFATFRRFRALNMKNLLYFQAELTGMELQLHQAEIGDNRLGSREKRSGFVDWRWLHEFNEDQWKTVTDIRKVLKEYNDALIQQMQLSELAEPNEYNLKTFRYWMAAEPEDDQLVGDDSETWGGTSYDDAPKEEKRKFREDLAVLKPKVEDSDFFTKFLVSTIIPVYQQTIGKDFMNGKSLKEYSDDAIIKFTNNVATLFACVLPTVAIIILYNIHSMSTRLGVIAALTAGFSIALMIVTQATRVEIFTATAAFSAVMVVFVNTQTTG